MKHTICCLTLFFSIVPTLILAGEDDKKDNRKAERKAKKAAEAARYVKPDPTSLPPLPEIKQLPRPVIDRTHTLTAEQVRTAADKIDTIIVAALQEARLSRNPKTSDQTFVRRAYLNIIGRIPTAGEASKFINSADINKRSKLIDELLLSPGFRSQQFNWIGDMIRLKSSVKRAKFAHFQRWIKDQIATNRPWSGMVYDMLTAEGSLASSGPAGYLLRDSGMPLDSLANTLSVFLGANVSCAQCHDHPLAEWTQAEFYEMAAFFGATDVSSRDPRKVGNALKDSNLSKQDIIHVVAPNLYRVHTTGKQSLVIPEDYAYDDYKAGEKVDPHLVTWDEADYESKAYQVDLKNESNLRHSFASWMTHKENPRFAINIANRLWKRLFGIATIEPIEDTDNLRKASIPELAEQIGDLMTQLDFDTREFQRVILNTNAWQAEANVTPAIGDIDDYLFAGPVLRRMTAEQAWDSILTLVEGTKIDHFEIDTSSDVTKFAFPYDEMNPSEVKSMASAMKAAGYISGGRKPKITSTSLVDKKSNPKKFDGTYLIRASELPQPTQEDHFLRMFGQSTREIADDGSLEGSIPQTLMLMNGKFQSLITDEEGELMSRLANYDNKNKTAEALYMSYFSREPDNTEKQKIRKAINSGVTIAELNWILFNTPEFIFIQ